MTRDEAIDAYRRKFTAAWAIMAVISFIIVVVIGA
jgi:hypothetical protein